MSRVKLKVTLTYFVTSVLSYVIRRYRQSRESLSSHLAHVSPVSQLEVNVNHDRFLTLTKWLCCL